MNSLHVHTCGGSIIALDELGRRAKWHWWLKSGVSSGGRSSEGVIVVSGVLTHTYIRWHAYTHLHTTKMLRLTHPNESGFLFCTVARG